MIEKAPKIAIVLFLAIAINASGQQSPAADFYISPIGSDTYSGRLAQSNRSETDGPFKTLQKARDSVRNQIKTSSGDVVVMLRGGRYLLNETVCFGLQDSGKTGQRIIYRNYPGEKPILTAAIQIDDWDKAADDISGLPTKAKGNVWVASIAPSVKPFAALYLGDVRLVRAVSQGFSTLKERTDPTVSTTSFSYPPNVALKNWDNIGDVEIVARPMFEWPMCIVPLEHVDEKNRIATVSVPAPYPFAKLMTMTKEDVNNAWIENAIEFLDKPGEWVLDTKQSKLFFWPIDGKKPDDILAPQLTELIKVEGDIDYGGPIDVPVRNITFEGLTFTQADRFKWPMDHVGWGLQSDWEIFDHPSAMVRLRGVENCTINNCRFINSAAAGIRLDLYCQNVLIHDNLIATLGGVGILLDGYGPGTKNVNKGNYIANNYIHDIGQIYWGSPAIYLWQSGENLVVHNLIKDTPYSGIAISGPIDWRRSGNGESAKTMRWSEIDKTIDPDDKEITKIDYRNWSRREPFVHARRNIIERNEITGVVERLSDGNGIYLFGAGKQNIIRLNYVHNNSSIRMREGIRCDDDQYETTIERNVVYKNGGTAVGIIIKGKNDIINNIIADLVTGDASYDSCYYALQVYPADGAVIQRNVIYSEDRRQNPCEASTAWYYKGPGPEWRTTSTDYNIYFNTRDSTWLNHHFAEQKPLGVDVHSIFADPGFEDIDRGNFLLKPESPALKLGFEQIDVSEDGLTRDFPSELLK